VAGTFVVFMCGGSGGPYHGLTGRKARGWWSGSAGLLELDPIGASSAAIYIDTRTCCVNRKKHTTA